MGESGEEPRPARPPTTGRRFTLPSGQVVEVVRAQRSPQLGLPGALHVCGQCRSELVQPLEWSEAGAGRWQVDLLCPNCGWSHHGTFDGSELAELEEHLDHGFEDLMRDLKRLRSANMTEEIERFADALEADVILPEDF
jgi:hypothetical protein